MQMLSTSTSIGIEEVTAAHDSPVWYQLYAPSSWPVCEKILRRVEAAGSPVIALTVDNTTGRNSETYLRVCAWMNSFQVVARLRSGAGARLCRRRMLPTVWSRSGQIPPTVSSFPEYPCRSGDRIRSRASDSS
jgi:hypothetical protein